MEVLPLSVRKIQLTLFGQPVIPFGSFSANNLILARAAIGLYVEYGNTNYLPPDLNNGELKVYDLDGDEIIDCAIIQFIITIKYLHWM
jgi:hypothetical protein